MGFSFVQGAYTVGVTAANLPLAFPANVTGGNILVACFGIGTGNPINATDSQGNTYNQIGTTQFGGITTTMVAATIAAATSGPCTITAHFDNASPGNSPFVGIAEYGTTTGVATDGSGQLTAGGAPSNTQSITFSTASQNDLLVYASDLPNGGSDTVTPTGGLTLDFQGNAGGNGLVFLSKVVTLPGSQTGGINTSGGRDFNSWFFGFTPSATADAEGWTNRQRNFINKRNL